jgi:hypothetical protein
MLLTFYGLGDVALTWSYFCLYCAQFASESIAVSRSYELSDPDLAVQSIVHIGVVQKFCLLHTTFKSRTFL